MKLLLVVCLTALVGLSCGNQLSEDVLDFAILIPPVEINEILSSYLLIPEFQDVLKYVLNSQEFKDIIVLLETVSEYMKVLMYLNDSGLDIYRYLDILYEQIGLKPFPRPTIGSTIGTASGKKTKDIVVVGQGIKDIVVQCRDEIRAILPEDKIVALHEYKIANSPAFKYFGERLETAELKDLLQKLNENKVWQDSMATLEKNGVNIADSQSFYLELTGFKEIKKVSTLISKLLKMTRAL